MEPRVFGLFRATSNREGSKHLREWRKGGWAYRYGLNAFCPQTEDGDMILDAPNALARLSRIVGIADLPPKDRDDHDDEEDDEDDEKEYEEPAVIREPDEC